MHLKPGFVSLVHGGSDRGVQFTVSVVVSLQTTFVLQHATSVVGRAAMIYASA